MATRAVEGGLRVASVVAQLTREYGIRAALGTSPRDIVAGVLGQIALIVGAGAAAGLLTAAGVASRLDPALLFGVQSTDALPYAIVVVVLATVGLLAALVPARRAARVDPIQVLRAD